MCSLSNEQSILSKETIQETFFFFFSELCPIFDLNYLSSIKHPTAEHWHLITCFECIILAPPTFSEIEHSVHIYHSFCEMFFV